MPDPSAPATSVTSDLIKWWKTLDNDKSTRAELRRASCALDAVMCPGFQRLQRQVVALHPARLSTRQQQDRLALVCALMSHVTSHTDSDTSLPKAMSAKQNQRPVVSELRFRRLLESPDDEALFTGLRRALPLLGHTVNLASLINSVLYWGDSVKRNWAYEYDWQ